MQSQIDNIYACLEKAGIQLPINVNQSSDVGSSHRPHVQTSSHDGCSPLVDYSKVNDQKDAQLDETSKGKDDELEESFT
ncbi:hypothetical protein Scep_012700 [Stephania cephalantha]|uniref:Uncharacterized protein n=1 Tax=Stephania cephalantha TaxID=152367 RepID=A0AAP0JHU4_9MAGN